jgi:hypothetical protein
VPRSDGQQGARGCSGGGSPPRVSMPAPSAARPCRSR